MKIFNKIKDGNKRKIYFLGKKIFSYKKVSKFEIIKIPEVQTKDMGELIKIL
jgi:hypothetical protein